MLLNYFLEITKRILIILLFNDLKNILALLFRQNNFNIYFFKILWIRDIEEYLWFIILEILQVIPRSSTCIISDLCFWE